MNYYEILGLDPKASDHEIKDAYRREAMKWHPDRHNGAAAKGEADRRFKDLAVAYRTLRDSSARADYDLQLEKQLSKEFEARQQEQQRSKHKRAGSDFADTMPPFENNTASSADANQMFYEQMLDLAFELAGRGFPEFNILKALIALGCPEALAKRVATQAARSSSESKESNTSNPKPANPLNSPQWRNSTWYSVDPNLQGEIVIKPKRRMAIMMALFGLGLFIWSFQAWSVPIGAPSWSGNGPFGIPEFVIQYFIRFLGGPLGVLALIVGGQWCISNTLMIIDNQGIRFSRGGGRLTKWDVIDSFTFEEKKLRIGGKKNGHAWAEEHPGWLIDGDCHEILKVISRFKGLSDSVAKNASTT